MGGKKKKEKKSSKVWVRSIHLNHSDRNTVKTDMDAQIRFFEADAAIMEYRFIFMITIILSGYFSDKVKPQMFWELYYLQQYMQGIYKSCIMQFSIHIRILQVRTIK